MPSLSLIPCLSLLTLLSLSSHLARAAREDDTNLFHFVTRPDLKPPKWNITVHDQESLSPGYWFLAPYKSLHDQDVQDGWVGPTIYEGNGDLIWSGAAHFGNRDFEDFRISNVRGEQLITFMHPGEEAAMIMDSNFTVRHQVQEVANKAGQINTHELHFVEDGTEAIVIKTAVKDSSEESAKAIGYEGRCMEVKYDGFEVLDTATWEVKFSWYAGDHIGLDESTHKATSVEENCKGQWDYVHANSVDKTSDGNYLLSCRHTDAIYHIDGQTGEILWRLGGTKSSFELGEGARFSRQHNIRWRGSDGRTDDSEGKMWISMLDNAKGQDEQETTHDMSRGLRLALDSVHWTAEVDLQIEHPSGKDHYAFRRGNYQVLSDDNIFIGWSEQALQSEHSPDGRLLMEASLAAGWLGTYRSYKFPFVGRPTTRPDVAAFVTTTINSTETMIHASWNGATDIATWNVYSTDATGQTKTFVTEARKTGFESALLYASFAEYLVVEAVDKDAIILGESEVIRSKIAEEANLTMIALEILRLHDNLVDENGASMSTRLWALVAVAVVGYAGLAAFALSHGRAFPAKWRLASWTNFRGRRYRDASEGADESNVELFGHREPLLSSSEKD